MAKNERSIQDLAKNNFFVKKNFGGKMMFWYKQYFCTKITFGKTFFLDEKIIFYVKEYF